MNKIYLKSILLILPGLALMACRTPIAGAPEPAPQAAAAVRANEPQTAPVASCGYSPAQCEILAHFGRPDRLENTTGADGRALEIWQWNQPARKMIFAAGRLINPRPDLRFYRQLKGASPTVNIHVFD